jgi:enoyl-CoA hydratase
MSSPGPGPDAPSVIETAHGQVLVILINRPDARNAINHDVTEGLLAAFATLDGTDSLSIGVLAGAGPTFCAGMDLKEFARQGMPRRFNEVVEVGTTKPLVGALAGHVLAGGLELALICDLLVAAEDVTLGIPEAARGLFAAGGGLLRLPRRLPYAVAMEMALTGDPIRARAAHEFGLVSRVTPTGESLDEALALAERIARNAPLSLAASKQLIRQGAGLSDEEFWAVQRPLIKSVFRSADAREGSMAFAEKRDPVWSGA